MSRNRSYSITANGDISYNTPLQMSRGELYENIPFTAVFGLQKKERNLSVAVSSYAADLDVMDAENGQFFVPECCPVVELQSATLN